MDDSKTSRREFCAHAISFVTIASVIEGCGSNSSPTSPGGGGSSTPSLPTLTAAISGGRITLNIDSGSPLANVGSAALLEAPGRQLLVARTGQETFNAMTAVCTHEGCTITGFASGTFVCPCHGSQYSTSGQVRNGPATRSLQTFGTQFTNNVLTITL
jgi:Rieske Fe-S protein